MFQQFLEAFPRAEVATVKEFKKSELGDIRGLNELYSIVAGQVFGGGILRVYSEPEILWARGLIAEMFPEISKEILPLTQDWMGRLFSVCLGGKLGSRGQLHLIEPGSGEIFEIDCGIFDLFNVEMVDDPVTYLSSDLWEEWLASGSSRVPEKSCVGFKVPLFLGGAGAVDNLEVIDIEVYWSLLGQLRIGTKDLPSGGKVSDVWIDYPK